MQDDQGDEIAAALDRLHAGGWSVGDAACSGPGGIIHVVIGTNGENQIRAEGATCSEAWRRALSLLGLDETIRGQVFCFSRKWRDTTSELYYNSAGGHP